jgi:SAM-dependent methyltransferase
VAESALTLRWIAEQPYDPPFFDVITRTASASAAVVVPFLLEWLRPRSVVDVGCGEGAWLAPFATAGCRVVGIDGPQVRRERFLVAPDALRHHDLEAPFAAVLGGARFDLALCLEVAEHLSPGRADGLVDDLVALSDRILFSAAVPGQGGYGHVNEQPHDYWIRRFEDRGYAATAAVRRRFAGDERLASWYRANLFLLVRVTSC